MYIRPDRPTKLFERLIESVDSDIIVLGHTHHLMCVAFNNRLIVNPGSIFSNRNREERTCGVLTLPDNKFQTHDMDTGQEVAAG